MADFIFPFEKLDVWHLAKNLAEFVLELLEKIPVHKHMRLIGEMEAAVTSPAQNIAEGKGRQYKKNLFNFYILQKGPYLK